MLDGAGLSCYCSDMTNTTRKVRESLSAAAWRASILWEDVRNGNALRYYRMAALERIADVLEPVRKVSGRLPLAQPFHAVWLGIDTLGVHVDDLWVLAGREWEAHLDPEREGASYFFLAPDSAPETRAERAARM